MSRAKRARKLIAELEGRGARFFLDASGAFGLAHGGIHLERRQLRELERCAQEVAQLVLQRAQAVMRPQSQMIN